MNRSEGNEPASPKKGALPHSNPVATQLGCWLIPICFVAMLYSSHLWTSKLTPNFTTTPSGRVDEIYNDNLAINLAADDGFELRFSGSDWLDVYTNQNTNGQYDWLYNVVGEGKTTTIAPGYPFLLSLNYRAFDRGWETIRSLSALLLAIALTVLISQIGLRFGLIAMVVVTASICFDTQLHQSSYFIAPQAFSAAILALAFCAAVHAWNSKVERQRPSWRWPLVGALLGLLAIFHWQANFWLVALFLLGILGAVWQLVRVRSPMRWVQGFGLFVVGALLIASPWWVRNCRVTKSIKPFGNLVENNIVGGYSDATFDNNGNWQFSEVLSSQEDFINRQSTVPSLLHQEKQLAEINLERAQAWVEANPSRVSKLAMMKVGSHLGLLDASLSTQQTIVNWLILVGGLLGVVVTWREQGWFVATILLLSIVTVALTWSDFGKHFIPVRPLMHAALGGLVGWTVQRFARRAKEVVPLKPSVG